ncbi:peptidoglycan recognition protein [Streptomyces sp. NBC_01363]|uniref:peptidoglycan recognition protein family protein n=1 Tax=Streptomyces sp. NBC_01363 TaxID=2903840 RepID=UPI002254FE81|nr:peptidoglycan recognition protein [Streptomyces sp. NBC_01363]MCX4729752.1 peptidoglycan recognition protein [Streptomyces sp. NBC_01363]
MALPLLAAPAGVATVRAVRDTTPEGSLSAWQPEAVAQPAVPDVDIGRPFPALGATSMVLPRTVPRPAIVSRAQWRADETKRDPRAHYAEGVRAVFIHHTDTPNGYDCANVPRTLRNLYTGQTRDRSWGDLGYNFLVDKCGTIYEGRAGGADRPVVGSHTLGFNQGTAGIAAIGTFGAGASVPAAMEHAIAALAAWKLGLSGIDAADKVRLTSTNGKSRYAKGTSAEFDAISGHRDGFATNCPGDALRARLPAIRKLAARLQGRPPRAPSGARLTASPGNGHRSSR